MHRFLNGKKSFVQIAIGKERDAQQGSDCDNSFSSSSSSSLIHRAEKLFSGKYYAAKWTWRSEIPFTERDLERGYSLCPPPPPAFAGYTLKGEEGGGGVRAATAAVSWSISHSGRSWRNIHCIGTKKIDQKKKGKLMA